MPETNLQKYVGTPEDQAAATEAYLQGLRGLGTGAASYAIPPVATGETASDWHNYVPDLGAWFTGVLPQHCSAINS